LCGISFVLDPSGGTSVASLVRRLHEPIRHRGPDAERFLIFGRDGVFETPDTLHDREAAIAAGAFRRLKIIDVSDESMQPMIAPDRSAALLFNGEIYNFRALRSELESRGHVFRSTGDTEVVLEAWREWEEGCFDRLDGMWAIVIADFRKHRIVASRDRFGIKPLHWCIDRGALLLASEARQILRARDSRPVANAERVARHIAGTRYPVPDETFFDGVHCVPPSTWFSMSFDEVAAPKFVPYWALRDVAVRDDISYPAAVSRFAELFDAAVRSHHVADVAIGTLLSGGLDSAMVTAVLADVGRAEGRKFPAFSFGFRDEYREFSELPYVDAMVRAESLEHHETGFDAAWVAANAARVVESIEEPPLALPVLAQFRTFELVRQHGVTVVLDGQGADEIFGGYPYHQRIATTEMVRRGRIGDFVREMRAIARRGDSNVAAQFGEFYLAPLASRVRREKSLVRAGYGSPPSQRFDASAHAEAVNRRLYYDVRWGNVKIILQYADRNAMAHSIEARVPFFDRALVELAFSLPASFKVGEGERKRVQRDAARKRVPREITERGDRMGFATPDVPMLVGPLRATVRETVNRFTTESVLDRGTLADVVRRFDRGDPSTVRTMWRLYTLALWSDVFGVAFR
jgi:asparagine synthase (glutamine-hydrolysing)